MDIGIKKELFMPLTPIKTPPSCTTYSRKRGLHEEEEEEDEAAAASCHTPKSESSPPARCPPTPTKPRPVRRKISSSEAPKLVFFQVPEDLASVFRLISTPNKKIRTS